MSGKRSKLEERVSEKLESEKEGIIEYESEYLYFTQPSVSRKYLPDFKLANGAFIEVKGRLTLEDRKKMLWVKQQNPEATIYFIFGNGNNKITKKSKVTYIDWAETNGFEAIDVSQPIPKRWFKNKEKYGGV